MNSNKAEITIDDAVKQIPKVELHQHVDGSIPVPVTWKLMKEYNLNPVESEADLHKLLRFQDDTDEGSLLAYLDKFHYPLWITQFYENVANVVEAIVEDAVTSSNVSVLELRYSPTIHTLGGMTIRQTITSVFHGMKAAQKRFNVRVGLIIIAMRHQGPHIAKILARSALAEAQHLHENVGVIGFDIAGAERGNPPKLFREAFDIARRGRLGLTAHAGEDEGPHFVWQAIDELGVKRLGHANSALQDPELLRRLAKDRILVECCLTSNWQTGAASRTERPPLLGFLEAGVPVAICTDNTTVSSTNQNKETQLLTRYLSVAELARIHLHAAGFSFIQPHQ